MRSEEVWQNVSQIVADYPLLECDRCAASVMDWLRDRLWDRRENSAIEN